MSDRIAMSASILSAFALAVILFVWGRYVATNRHKPDA
jgi:hypothetical protein